ncbi:MAG: L-threonylcarbamoyladenylate synthase [Armatimonadota bacterium]
MRPLRPVEPNLRRAANALLAGDLVVLPTETVYGLAADAANPEAVAKIFEAKGRPPENPLIVHVSHMDAVELWSDHLPKGMLKLARAFWPGPLTVVLPKNPRVPDIVTAGLDTVAIRIPSHSLALAVLEMTGMGLAMPSANPFMGLSPTRADRIDPTVAAHVTCIIDGGPCRVGIESTVLDLSDGTPKILRPGMITAEEIEAVIGSLEVLGDSDRKSPGMYRRHYSPRVPTVLVHKAAEQDAGLVLGYTNSPDQIQMPSDPVNYAKKLYVALSDLEARQVNRIVIEEPPKGSEWAGVWDRVSKATASE